jgi:hypothetical protein
MNKAYKIVFLMTGLILIFSGACKKSSAPTVSAQPINTPTATTTPTFGSINVYASFNEDVIPGTLGGNTWPVSNLGVFTLDGSNPVTVNKPANVQYDCCGYYFTMPLYLSVPNGSHVLSFSSAWGVSPVYGCSNTYAVTVKGNAVEGAQLNYRGIYDTGSSTKTFYCTLNCW